MATKCFLRQTQLHRLRVPIAYDMLLAAGAAAVEKATNTAASGTEIQLTDVAGGAVIEWISPPLSAGFTLATTDTMTFNVWMRESNMNANAGARARVYKWANGNGAVTELPGGPYDDGVEFGTADAVMNWTGVVSSNQTFVAGDRLIVRYFLTNIGTMGGGFTCTLSFDGPTGAADGDSWFQLTNNVTFDSEDVLGIGFRLQKPPLEASGRRGHPLCPNHAYLLHGVSPYENAIIRDHVGGIHGKILLSEAATSGIIATPGGLRIKAGSTRLEVQNMTRLLPGSQGSCVFGFRGRYTSDIVVLGSTLGTSSDVFKVQMTSGTTMSLYVTNINDVSAASVDLSTDAIYVVSWGLRGQEIWKDGLLLASTATIRTPAAISTDVFRINSGGGDKTWGFVYLYRRQLTRAEAQWVSRAPF